MQFGAHQTLSELTRETACDCKIGWISVLWTNHVFCISRARQRLTRQQMSDSTTLTLLADSLLSRTPSSSHTKPRATMAEAPRRTPRRSRSRSRSRSDGHGAGWRAYPPKPPWYGGISPLPQLVAVMPCVRGVSHNISTELSTDRSAHRQRHACVLTRKRSVSAVVRASKAMLYSCARRVVSRRTP